MTPDELAVLAGDGLEDIYADPPNEALPDVPHRDDWGPDLNPTQDDIFHWAGKYGLAYGERASGKSVGCLHKLVRHCYENFDALALIAAPTQRSGKFGVMDDLEKLVLPTWTEGNRWPAHLDGSPHPRANQLKDSGIGLIWKPARLDPNTKDQVLKIQNRFGGWSTVLLLSIPYEETVQKRMKTINPSFVYAEEITNLDGKGYFTYISAQLGRRRHITDPQQYLASCNPDGPSHWVYEVFWKDCLLPSGERDPDFEVWHVPILENRHRLPPGYFDGLLKIYIDPTERRQMLDGEWVDRPSGNAIFRDFFAADLHVVGDPVRNIGLWPAAGYPIIVSLDTGPANFSVHFLQCLPRRTGNHWIVFDELNFVGQYRPYDYVVPRILERMDYWIAKRDHAFRFQFVAGDDAFSFRDKHGDLDAAVIQKLARGRIRILPCPRGRESVVARVNMLRSFLLSETIVISATCRHTIDMLRLLCSKRQKPGEYDPDAGLKPIRSPYLHSFDSLTHGPFYHTVGAGSFTPERGHASFRCGDLAV